MTTPDFENVTVFSVVMAGTSTTNPIIIAGTKYAAGSNTRIAIPKGVSHVFLSTQFKGSVTLVVNDGGNLSDANWWANGGGGLTTVGATTDSAYIYLRAAAATTTDRFNIIVTTYRTID